MKLLTVITLSLVFGTGPEPDKMTPELLWKLGRVSAPEVSPDGKMLVFQISYTDLAKNSANSDIYVMATEGGAIKRLTTHEKSDFAPKWSPNGKDIGFLSTRNGAPQLFTIDPTGGEAIQVTNVPEGIANFAWSPDGNNISFTSSVRLDKELKTIYPDLPKADAKIIDGLMFRHWNFWYDGTYSHLMVMPRAGGTPLDVMKDLKVTTPLQPFGGATELAWAPDGKELCYTAKIESNPAVSTNSDLYLVPATGGAAKNITQGMNGFDKNPLYSPDGKWIAFTSMKRPGFEADRERLMLFDRKSGKIDELSKAFDNWVEEMCWAPDSKSIFFVAAILGTKQAFQIDLEGKVKQITKGEHDISGIAVSPDAQTVYAVRRTIVAPNEIVSFPAAGGEIKQLTFVNKPIYDKLKLPTVKERWIVSTDGKKVHCWVTYPPDFDPNKKYPMITYCQGGPQQAITQMFSTAWNFHLMAAKGYIVCAVNRRGLPSFGQEWNDAISKDWGGQAMLDLQAATDDMFKETYVDRKHTAAIGASFGGYTIYWLMGHDQKDRFACMVAHCGVFNLESMSTATEELWFTNWDLGQPYWNSEEAQKQYAKHSPHKYVQNWDTPLLVIHGEKDYRVPIGEGLQAFTAAQVRGVPSKFLYYPNEGHWVIQTQNQVLWHRVFFDWLDRFCKPSEGK